MRKLFAILSSVFCLSVACEAASYPYDRPCDDQCVGQCVDPCVGQCDQDQTCGKFYVGAFGGANWMHIRKLEGAKLDSKVGFAGALSLGYKFDNSIRIEGEVAYRRNNYNLKLKDFSYLDDSLKCGGHVHSWSYMANFLYDFDQVSNYLPKVVPYVGVGIGYAHSKADVKVRHEDNSFHGKGTEKGIAYQGIAGVGYHLTDTTILAVEYRYFAAKKDLRDHSVGLALRQSF